MGLETMLTWTVDCRQTEEMSENRNDSEKKKQLATHAKDDFLFIFIFLTN